MRWPGAHMKNGMKDKIKSYIKTWEARCYPEGLPDEVPPEICDRVPSYKRICIAILKNDTTLETLGYSRPVSLVYNAIKREEIKNRNNDKETD